MSYPSESPFNLGSQGGEQPEPPSDESSLQTASFGDSGHLKSAAYQPDTGVLEVTFSDGSKYKYAGVEPTLVEDFYIANEGPTGSFGKFFSKYIRGGGYKGQRVSESDSGDSES